MAERDSWAVGATSDRRVGAEDARLGVGMLLVPGSTPINARGALRPAPGSPWLVQATGTPGANVTVNAGQQTLNASRGFGPYLATLDATKTVAILDVPADPSNQRNDLIIAQQSDVDYGDATRDFVVKRVQGTPSGSPVDPTVTGSPDFTRLARVRVTAGATTITNAMIDDLRPGWVVALGGLLPLTDVTARNGITPAGIYDGYPAYRMDRDWIEVYNGSTWQVVNAAVCSSTADRDSAITNPYNGQLAFTTDTNTLWVRQAGVWTSQPDAPTFHLRRTTLQTIANNTFTAISFDAEDEDSHNGHSTVSNTDRYTVPKAGVYWVSGAGIFVPNATGVRLARLTLNGSLINGSGGEAPNNGASENAYVATRSFPIRLAVNDIVRLEVLQNSGGNLDTATTNYLQPSLDGMWIHP